MYIQKQSYGSVSVLTGKDIKNMRTRKQIKDEESLLGELNNLFGENLDKIKKSLISEFNYSEQDAEQAVARFVERSI